MTPQAVKLTTADKDRYLSIGKDVRKFARAKHLLLEDVVAGVMTLVTPGEFSDLIAKVDLIQREFDEDRVEDADAEVRLKHE